MKRVTGFLFALGLGSLMCLTGAAAAQPQPSGPPSASNSPKVAVFNMAVVMADFNKVKYHVYKLNQLKIERSSRLLLLRGELIKLDQVYKTATDAGSREKLAVDLKRKERDYQDENEKVSHVLHTEASTMISSLYDEIKLVVEKTAEMNGYDIVFAYPDVARPADMSNPSFKEFKLKPSAAMPFYVSKKVDITAVVVQTLNNWYPPKDEQGRPVDVSALKMQDPAAVNGVVPGTGTQPPVGTPTSVLPAGTPPMTPVVRPMGNR